MVNNNFSCIYKVREKKHPSHLNLNEALKLIKDLTNAIINRYVK